jgi:hypothetical protein
LNIFVPVVVGIAVGLLFAVRRGPKPRDIVASLSENDRQFLADELEWITRLPLRTAQEEDTWYAATREMQRRLRERFGDAASVVPHRFTPYFQDPDIHRKEPAYRAAQEKHIIDFIRQLRAKT